jgi:hypothetical protein
MLESSVTQQEDYYRKSLSEMTDQHAQEMKIMTERMSASEAELMATYRNLTEEFATLQSETQELKARTTLTRTVGNDSNFLLSLQNDNNALHQRIKDVQAEKDALEQRLKVFYPLMNSF